MEMIFHSHTNKNSFSQGRLCTWPHFESEGFWNSEVAYLSWLLQSFQEEFRTMVTYNSGWEYGIGFGLANRAY